MHFKKRFYDLCPLICILCSFFLGCATPEDLGRMQWDINNLKTEIKDISKKSQNIATQIPGQKKQLNEKLEGIDATQKSTAKTVSDLFMQVQSLTTEFQVLTGRFEEARYSAEKSSVELQESKEMLTEQMKELSLEVDNLKKKVAQMEMELSQARELQIAAEAKKAEEKKPVQTGKQTSSPDTGAKNLYMEAYQAYKEGKSAEARDKFTSLLNDFPENEYSDNARFWIGEAYYRDSNFEDAILAYEELFRKNPKSDKVPGALLKQGLAFYSLKDKKTGQIILEKLIAQFPDSEQAKLAKKKMKQIVVPAKKK